MHGQLISVQFYLRKLFTLSKKQNGDKHLHKLWDLGPPVRCLSQDRTCERPGSDNLLVLSSLLARVV